MKTRNWTILFATSCLLFNVDQLNAHHGLDEYDTGTVIELKGKVIGFKLMSPHSLLYVDVENADGTVTSWVIEGGAAHGIVSAGLTRDALAAEPIVSVSGYQSIDKNCIPRCKANGREFTFE